MIFVYLSVIHSTGCRAGLFLTEANTREKCQRKRSAKPERFSTSEHGSGLTLSLCSDGYGVTFVHCYDLIGSCFFTLKWSLQESFDLLKCSEVKWVAWKIAGEMAPVSVHRWFSWVLQQCNYDALCHSTWSSCRSQSCRIVVEHANTKYGSETLTRKSATS